MGFIRNFIDIVQAPSTTPFEEKKEQTHLYAVVMKTRGAPTIGYGWDKVVQDGFDTYEEAIEEATIRTDSYSKQKNRIGTFFDNLQEFKVVSYPKTR